METEIKIRGDHTDLYQHVNNARYLEFLEEARPRLTMKIRIRSGMEKIRNKRVVVRQQVLNLTTGHVCVDADITIVLSDFKGKALKLEGEVLETVNRIPVFEE